MPYPQSLSSLSRLDALRNFFETYPLILKEVQEKRKLEKLGALKGDRDRHVNVVHLKWVRSILDKISNIRREHVYDADYFPHYGNPNYIFRKWSDELNREVVHLQHVCWLHFYKDFRVRVPSMRLALNLNQYKFSNENPIF